MQTIINYFVVLLTLCTATGVLIHDIRLDTAAYVSLSKRTASKQTAKSPTNPGTDAGVSMTGDPHTHPHNSAKTLKGFAYKNPAYPPRENRMKKFLQQNHEPRGRHAFDNYHLPIVA